MEITKINTEKQFDELLANIKQAIKDVNMPDSVTEAEKRMGELEDEGLEARGIIFNEDEEFESAIGGKDNLSKYVDEWGCYNEAGIAIANELDAKRKTALDEIRSTEEYKVLRGTVNDWYKKQKKAYRFMYEAEGALCTNRSAWYQFKNYNKAVSIVSQFWGPDYD